MIFKTNNYMKKLFLSLAFLLPMMGTMAQTQVKTAEGILEGKDLSGIKVFKGVPFAAPPVATSDGRLRSQQSTGTVCARLKSMDLIRCRNHSSAI